MIKCFSRILVFSHGWQEFDISLDIYRLDYYDLLCMLLYVCVHILRECAGWSYIPLPIYMYIRLSWTSKVL